LLGRDREGEGNGKREERGGEQEVRDGTGKGRGYALCLSPKLKIVTTSLHADCSKAQDCS